VAAAEEEARAAERARWAALVESERSAGERRVEEVRSEGKGRYMDLVRSIEAKYVAEFEAALGQIQARQEGDAAEARALEGRIRDLRAAVDGARGERSRLEADTGAAQARAVAEVSAKRSQLAALRQNVRAAWKAGNLADSDLGSFLRRVHAALPYSPALANALQTKLELLRGSAPILRLVTRREVLLFRLQAVRGSLADAQGRSATAGASGVARLQAELSATVSDLDRLADTMTRELTAWESTNGPFYYRGSRLLHSVQGAAADYSAPVAARQSPNGRTARATTSAILF